jgi:hypothetical protein
MATKDAASPNGMVRCAERFFRDSCPSRSAFAIIDVPLPNFAPFADACRAPDREGQSAAMNWLRIREIWYETLRRRICFLMGEGLSLRNQFVIHY